jgi:uncharacterized protein
MDSENTLPIELEFIREESRSRAHENDAFRVFIRQFKSSEFDFILHRIADEITARVDCTACGNCCRELHPAVLEEEIPTIAEAKGISKEAFTEQFLNLSENREYHVLNHPPCVFLDGTVCSIYARRPVSCGGYPHLDVADQKFRIRRLMDQYGVCPIVYFTVELLKKELGFA